MRKCIFWSIGYRGCGFLVAISLQIKLEIRTHATATIGLIDETCKPPPVPVSRLSERQLRAQKARRRIICSSESSPLEMDSFA